MAELTLNIVGTGSLLTHNPISMFSQNSGGKKGNIHPSPEEDAEMGCYRLEDGGFGLPGVAFRSAIVKAAGQWKAKRQSMASILAHIEVKEEFAKLTTPDGEPIKSYEIDRRRVVIQKQGVIRARPKFTPWAAQITIVYDEQLVPNPSIITDIATDAGRRIGVGDYRPERKGWFGRFSVKVEE